MKVTIYHNPRCSKSKQTLQLIEQKGIKPTIIEYLKTPPQVEQIDEFLKSLAMQPRDLMRKNEDEYKENNVADESLSHQQLLAVMFNHPKLIQRPIVVVESAQQTRVALGRPPENVLKILS
ncbi:MAG: arsenate reductase (glutaredoxin) [Pseudomonadota bacterium]